MLRVHALDFEDSPFVCDQCPCAFRKIGALNAHVSKFHTELSSAVTAVAAAAPVKEEQPLPPTSEGSNGKKQQDDAVTAAVWEETKQNKKSGFLVLADKDPRSGKVKKHLVAIQVSDDGKTHLFSSKNVIYRFFSRCESVLSVPTHAHTYWAFCDLG